MARQLLDAEETRLAREASERGVLTFFSQAARAEGRPHIRLFARGGNVAELSSVEAAREWLRLQEAA